MPKEKSPYRNSLFKSLQSEWYDLDLTNKVLLLIGLVLLFELIFSIFIRSVDTDATTDAFFRLALSSVLGYFLGINTGNQNINTNAPKLESTTTLSKPIFRQTENEPLELTADTEECIEPTNIRTLFISFVCLACIITLSFTTFYNQSQYEEGLIQLRNIISTTIGFLISKANRRN